MDLARYHTSSGPRWAVDDRLLPVGFSLGRLFELPAQDQVGYLKSIVTLEPAAGTPLAPIEHDQEVWAAGVTYLRSREAREAESATGDIYARVYAAERPELFFKAPGWRVVGPGGSIRVRRDSAWNVPEPELTLAINRHGEVCGYTAGNDVSSRSIEGENPLYLPQAKVYNGSCALGPRIRLVDQPQLLRNLPIRLTILRGGDGKPSSERSSAGAAGRGGREAFQGETSTRLMKRAFDELSTYLFRELDFPQGAFLMTGTGIVPPESFTLQARDVVQVEVGDILLENEIAGN